ncbi:MAG TPA: acetamidase/formamidase family protein [Euzebyales bacterium]
MATHEIRADYAVPLAGQPATGHNRWHPDVPPAVRCDPGDEVVMDTRDALDGQITSDATVDDVANADLGPVHPLTGPVYVEGAEPGDLLVVDVVDVTPADFGFTVQIPGFGFLREDFPEPHLIRWDLASGFATSEDLPGVRIPAAPFLGTFGVAPSRDLMAQITAREQDLLERGGMVLPPDPAGAVPDDPAIANDALRTIPPRENAGNVDIRQCGVGARLYIPVWTDGALFSGGDAHYAQGDNESCGTAIEMRATFTFRFDVRKGEAARHDRRRLRFERSDYWVAPEIAAPRAFYATTGLSIDADGVNHSEDVTVATREALREMIDHLTTERGFDRQQAYALCSVAVDLRIAALPDVPNMVVTALLPTDIFV